MKYFYAILTTLSLSSMFILVDYITTDIEYHDMSAYEITITPNRK